MKLRFLRVGWGMTALMALLCVALSPAQAGENASSTAPQRGVRMPRSRRTPAPAPAQPKPLPQPSGAAAASASETQAAPTAPRLDSFQTAGGTKMIRMDIRGVEIDDVLRLLGREAGIQIVKSEQVTGPITVIAPEPVPLDVAFEILDSILQIRGFTMVRSPTGIYKVIPVADARQSGLPLEFGGRPEDVASTDTLITQVVPLRNLGAQDTSAQVKLLLPNAVLIETSTNSLVITDTAINVQRALTLIAETEAQLSGGYVVIPLQYYGAADMADLVDSLILLGGAGGAARAPRPAYERRVVQARPTPAAPARAPAAVARGAGPEFCYPDTRTNSLIVLATPTHLEQIRNLVEQLDHQVSLRDSYYVYPVQNLIASELAALVAPLIGAEVQQTAALQGAVGAAAAQRAGAQGRLGQQGGFGGAGGLRTPTRLPTTRVRTNAVTPAEQGQRPRAAGVEVEPLAGVTAGAAREPITIAQAPEGAVVVQPQPAAPPPEITINPTFVGAEEVPSVPGTGAEQATITPDDNSNVLLIAASPEQIDLARQLLEKLDVLPPQVLIQVIIAEVQLSRDTSLGFQWESLGRTFGTFYDGDLVNQYVGDISSNFGLGATDDEGNPVRSAGFFGQVTGPEFSAMLKALTTDSHVRILSAPSIFTCSNQTATIDVSNQRPFPSGTLTSSVTSGTAVSTSIDYQSVGIVLSVTPRVTQGNIVQMDVSVQADEVGQPVSIAGQEYPSTLARHADGILYVKDGYTIVLGGLMRDTIARSASRVPLLGDLPIIGSLFRSTSSRREKSELLVFLTPRVVRSEAEAAALTEEQKSKLLEVPRSLQTPADGSSPAQ